MPKMKCVTKDGKSGVKWGRSGKCYSGKDAEERVEQQRKAIEVNKRKRNAKDA